MKRFICAMLTLIMLVGMVPVTTANAASNTTSGAAITVLKTMSSFKKDCYQVADTKEFRIGYGTICKEDHQFDENGKRIGEPHRIKEAAADKRLREQLKEMDKKVNSFMSSNSLSLKQNQFDALVLFSHLNGTAWMSGNGAVKTAVLNKAGATELLKAMNDVSSYSSQDFNKVMVNIYCNNVYSDSVPTNYSTVYYYMEDGHIAESGKSDYMKMFDTTQTGSHPVPTRNGYKFLGWYFRPEQFAGEATGRSTALNADCADGFLEGLWQSNDATYANAAEKNPAVNYTLKKSQLASSKIYDKPDVKEGKEIAKVEGDIKIDRDFIGSDGSRWARIAGESKWVLVSGGSNTAGSKAIGVTVTNDYVNSRKNADVHSAKNGSYKKGEKLYILTTKNADGFLWGQVAKSKDDHTPVGWVALMYTNWNSVKDSAGESGGSSDSNNGGIPSNAVATAYITFNGYVNVRNNPGTSGTRIVGSLGYGETVYVYEIKTVNGHRWGRTGAGWFCMTYANVTMTGKDPVNNDKVSDEGALAYTFSGKLNEDVETYTSTDYADLTKYQPKAGTAVTIHNIAMRYAENGRRGDTFVKIGWRVDTDGKNGADTTVYGWVNMPRRQIQPREAFSALLSTNTSPLQMDPVKFTTCADSVTVRDAASSGANSVFKLDKGVEVKIVALELVGEDIWGYQVDEVSSDSRATGWVNLSGKYFTRNNLPADPTTPTTTGKVATIVNTDSVNVRKSASKSGKLIGKLSRGTTANVLEIVGDWYNLDIDVDGNPKTGSWVYKDYVEVKDGSTGSNGGSGNGSANKPVTTGTGIVANTYSGVNVRNGAGTAYAPVGKLLPGTQVEILEMKTVGSSKWGRMNKGWVCMDYITMLTEDTVYPTEPGTPDNSGNGTPVGSYDEIDKTTTTAVYTGSVKSGSTLVYATTDHHGKDKADEDPSFAVRRLSNGDPVTIYELIAVTERIDVTVDEEGDGHGSTTEKVVTTYWARTNDGYIFNPQDNLTLDPLDEKTHTLTGAETLKVRQQPTMDSEKLGKLEQGDQVNVTALAIEKDKVWGRIEFEGEDGWIRLDYMAEGGYYVPETPANPPVTPPAPPVIGDDGNTGDGGFVNNGSGYRYTGKVINTDTVNVRATASQYGKLTTTMKSGDALVIYETTISEGMAWGRCDAGWVYLYYVDLTPCIEGAVDARVVYQENTIIYSDVNKTETVGTYGKMSVIDIYEVVGKMVRTDLGWVDTDNLL